MAGLWEVMACGLGMKGTKFMASLGTKHRGLGVILETLWTGE